MNLGKRILGIDPGSQITGYGIIDSDGRRSQHVVSGCIRTTAGEFPQRLHEIYAGVAAVIAEFHPQELAIETVFVARNASSALKLGQARGAALCAAFPVRIHEYAPRSVKQAIVGSGAADKAQVQHMVRVLLSLDAKLQADAADALAVAICHAHAQPATVRRSAGPARRRR